METLRDVSVKITAGGSSSIEAGKEFGQALIDQAYKAVLRYPEEKRIPGHFSPFVWFANPVTDRFLLGDVEGSWSSNGLFHLEKIIIHHSATSSEEVREISNIIQTVNPGVPKSASPEFFQLRELKR